MRHKADKYLASKPVSAYTKLDFIIKMYMEGKIEEILKQNNFYDFEISSCIRKKHGNTIQLSFKYYNLVGSIDFKEDGYDYIVYPMDKKIKNIDDLFVEQMYSEDFSVDNLISSIYERMRSHSDLRDNTAERKKKRKYRFFSNICLWFPVFICGFIALYGKITETKVVGNIWWCFFLIILPLILWVIFDIKSQK